MTGRSTMTTVLPTSAVVRRGRPFAPTLWLLVLFLAAVATGCGASGIVEGAASRPVEASATSTPDARVLEDNPSEQAATADIEQATAEPTAATDDSELEPGPTAVELEPAPIGFEALAELADDSDEPQPVSLRIEDLPLADATVIPVGVNEDQTFEVPPAEQVGWYRFGARPGEAGSAVLAAHIAYNGIDGVFRYLSDVEPGTIVEVGFSDGTSERYRIESVVDYLKDELPDSLFARSGKSQLALITCGGDFNPQLRSYESNTVAIAVPV